MSKLTKRLISLTHIIQAFSVLPMWDFAFKDMYYLLWWGIICNNTYLCCWKNSKLWWITQLSFTMLCLDKRNKLWYFLMDLNVFLQNHTRLLMYWTAESTCFVLSSIQKQICFYWNLVRPEYPFFTYIPRHTLILEQAHR
jgi:hypothetical protein